MRGLLRSPALRPWALALLALLISCADEQALLEVTVAGLSEDVHSLALEVSFAGPPPVTTPSKTVTGRLDELLVHVPAGLQGRATLTLYGADRAGCYMARGVTQITIEGTERKP